MVAQPLTFRFTDDGAVPNNPALPVLLYQRAVELGDDPAAELEQLFAENGWGHGQWRNGIYPFTHYHSMIHEALGIARGTRACASAATRAKWSNSRPATWRCCRPAPGISAFRAAATSW